MMQVPVESNAHPATPPCSSPSSSCSTESLTLDRQAFREDDDDDDAAEIPCAVESIDSPRRSYGEDDGVLESQAAPCCSYDSAARTAEDVILCSRKKWRRSKARLSCRLEDAAKEGQMLAAELLQCIKESLYSTVSHNLRAKMPRDWVSILSASVFGQCPASEDCIRCMPEWVVQPSSFCAVMDKVSQLALHEDHPQHSCVEDLLLAISRFEKAGLLAELRRLGLDEVASLLGGRDVFHGMFAMVGALREASNLLLSLRSAMKIPLHDTWSVAFNNDPHRRCLNHIRSICMPPEKYKDFAWKLDKVELCAKEIRCKWHLYRPKICIIAEVTLQCSECIALH